MGTAREIIRRLAWTFIAIFVFSLGTAARQAWAQEDNSGFRQEELAQMLAPIALYPDSLIAQILMASTYPLEVVEAERWLRDNETLKGDALSDALREKPWDPSVKSLCNFPDVLLAMSDNLDQTRKLGDAFLDQEQEVMDTIQELRKKAREQGSLETTPEQKVVVEREVIRIEPASPNVVYVPVYDPYSVYGPWWYPAYPPYYWYYPHYPYVRGGLHISFGPRIFIGLDLFSWVWFDWHVHRIYIDVPRTYYFHRYPVRPSYERYYWRHDPRHRRGVAYRDRRTGEHFGVPAQRQRSLQPETRGYPAGTVEKKAPATAAPVPDRRRERSSTPRETRPEQRDIQTAPSREISPSASALERERTITPERRREQKSVQPAPLREAPPSEPIPVRKRAIIPERQREQQRIESAPRQVTPPPPIREERKPAPAESIEPERTPSSGRDTPFRGITNGSFERKAGERGEQSRQSGEARRQNEGRKRQDDGSRGRVR